MSLNKSYIACLYYNLEHPKRYNIDSYKHRQLARKNFDNSVNYDEERLKKAMKAYKSLIDDQFDELLKHLEEKKTRNKS